MTDRGGLFRCTEGCTLDADQAMARPRQPDARSQQSPLVIRFKSLERRFLEAAKEREENRLRESEPRLKNFTLTYTAFIRSSALEYAEKVLGQSLVEFEKRERPQEKAAVATRKPLPRRG